MSLSIGIVGLPNVGKSTLFNALTKKSVEAANFPFCTIDPSVGVVSVPDRRLDQLAEMSSSEKVIPAAVEFVDIAGLVKGASEGEGLGNQFLANIREVDAIAQVVRVFDDTDITHVHDTVDPTRDIDIINLELVLADLQSVTKRRQGIEREVRSGDKEAIFLASVLDKLLPVLEAGKLANTARLDEKEQLAAKGLHLLTLKPFMYVLNKKSGGLNVHEGSDERAEGLKRFLEDAGATWVEVDAGVEHELSEVSDEDVTDFRRELGVLESGVDELIRHGYALLKLETFFTTGEKESRAWTIRKGSAAPEAGAAIHGDFRDKFIRANVIQWDMLLEKGSWAHARDEGLVRTEGKEYTVQDGDVMEFHHS